MNARALLVLALAAVALTVARAWSDGPKGCDEIPLCNSAFEGQLPQVHVLLENAALEGRKIIDEQVLQLALPLLMLVLLLLLMLTVGARRTSTGRRR